MKFDKTEIPDVIIVKPDIIRDYRGFFMESYHVDKFASGGIHSIFVQDNYAKSKKNTLRGLHFQTKNSQAKLLRCLKGIIFDVAVDLRISSPYYGKWVGIELSEKNKYQLYIPEGFAHGYCVISEYAEIAYKCSEIYCPEYDSGICWNDPDLAIKWPVKEPLLSSKDSVLPRIKDLAQFF